MICSKFLLQARRTLNLDFIRNGMRSCTSVINLYNRPLSRRHASTDHGNQDSDNTNTANSRWSDWALGICFASFAILTCYNKNKQTVEGWNLVKSVNAAEIGAGDVAGRGLRNKYNFIADVVEEISPAVVFIKNSSRWRQGGGSGFIVSADGLIVTNAHVVNSANQRKVEVQMSNGKKYTGEIQVLDTVGDLALVKINETNLPTIRLATSTSLRHGEFVIAMGSPLLLSNTVTSGIVSSTGRSISQLGSKNDIDYIQTDAAITFGNSGGPLINLDGEAVGVNTMKVTEGISFAIPADYVSKFLVRADDFKKNQEHQKSCRPPYVGIVTLTLSPHLAGLLRGRPDIKELEVDAGVFVVEVNAGSPAQQAGIEKYDVITKVDGKVINGYEDLVNAVRDKTTVKCIVYRQGSIIEIHICPKPCDK